MKSLKLIDGDLAFANDDFRVVEGVEEVEQSVYICTSTNKGEWFLDPTFGFNFFVVLGKNPTEEQIRNEMLQSLSKESRIETINDLVIKRENRNLNIRYKAMLRNGEEIESVVKPGVR